jgi:transposase
MHTYSTHIEGRMRLYFDTLSEKDQRRYAALEAYKLGRGGQKYMVDVLGCSLETIRRGLAEFDNDLENDTPDRIRGKGAGRKPYGQTHPDIDAQFLAILNEYTAGDPMDEQVKWTNLTHQEIADHLKEDYGTQVSRSIIRKLLKKHGFRRRKAQKKTPLKQVKDRNKQFENIARLKEQYRRAGQPIISIDTKKKEQIGNFYREGTLYAREPVKVFDHDFNRFADGVAIPHGVYDVTRNTGFINIGTSHDTSTFACDSLRRWWTEQGQNDWPKATSMLILCDCGGSNSSRYYIFKKELQALADELGLSIRVAHYPPYCSKYNPIEHRLFAHVSKACRGVILKSVQIVKELMGKTKTRAGLSVKVRIIDKIYEIGHKVSKQFKKNMRILKDNHLPQWNYVAVPAQTQNATVI